MADGQYGLGMTPESSVLLLCARRRVNPSEAARLQCLLEQQLDWRFILYAASRHGLLALLLSNLKGAACLDRVPASVAQKLQAAVREAAGRTLGLTGELIRILRMFSTAGLSAIPCKGPALAMAAYGDISLRSFFDLDILVRAEDLDRARRLLAQLGYRPSLVFSARQERDYLKNECALQLRHEQQGHVVELHWRLTERNASVDLPVGEFWQRARRLPLAGLPVLTLCPEDQILYLSVHGAKHRWERIEWIASLAELIRANPDLNWPAVFEAAESRRIGRLLNLSLHLAQSVLGAPLPEAAIQRLDQDPGVAALSHWVTAGLFDTSRNETHYQQRAARYWFMLRSREHWADRFRIVTYSAIRPPHPSSPEWIDSPSRLAFLNHIFRPVRLLSEYGAVAWHYYLRTR